jgi:OmpA-OmpF porin, OOP family
MATNLLDTISSYITPDIINRASSFIGESPGNTSKALTAIVPMLLNHVSNLASNPGGLPQLESLLGRVGSESHLLDNVSGLFSGTANDLMRLGKDGLGKLVGGNLGSEASSVSNFAGVSSSSATTLLSMAAPLVLGVLAKLKYAQGLTTDGLANLLSGQRPSFAAAIPSGPAKYAPSAVDVQGLKSVTVAPEVRKPWNYAWLALLLLPLLGWAIYSLHRPYNGPGGAVAARVARENVTLCNGQSVALLQDSFNYNLANYLSNGNNADLPKSFVFDHLNFDSATVNLTPESKATVDDLVTILRACPNTQVQLVGHTDNTGDPAANVTLSQNRANAVKDILVTDGISAGRITTAGFGQEKPIASNDTDNGRARNRRTELIVLKK